MKQRMTVKGMLSQIKNEKINTWFDLGLYIDSFKENKPVPTAEFKGNFDEFTSEINKGGIGFITFYYSIDGVTIEVEKYAQAFREKFKNVSVHYIAGKFYPESEKVIDPTTKKYQINEIKGFDDWTLYKDFFFTKLERGSKEYNALIIKFWKQVVTIVKKLGNYIEENDIQLLYLINVCSNPGNVSLSLATVLVSEYLGIPVINNNHDFYWEGGNREIDILQKGLKNGPRDFFLINSDVGEFFSQIEVLFPWSSRSWISVNINQGQSEHLIKQNGHNPANITEIGTAVDTKKYLNIPKRTKINAFHQVEKILSRYSDTVIGYSVKDIINNKLIDPDNPEPIIVAWKTKSLVNFLAENIIFLQPTRIIGRKRIEIGFKMVKKLFRHSQFVDKFKESEKLKLSILVTGPIPLGQFDYFEKVLKRFNILLEEIPIEFRERVNLAFMFSELDKESFKKRFENPIGIPELYNIASLILLPSKTEGRGLPIIEATATGVPIFCNRYYPEKVYSEVIGEHLPEKDRLRVIEFNGKKVKKSNIESITNHVFFPHKFIDEVEHNNKAVLKRYSIEALEKNIENILYKLYLQLKPNEQYLKYTIDATEEYNRIVNFVNDDLRFILNTKNRQYLAGYGKLSFMLKLKSLIDPSYFRVEEQEIKGIAFDFAKRLINSNPEKDKIPVEKLSEFYNAVDNIFYYKEGEYSIRHDHSFAYRHRNKKHYPYQDLTHQELLGLVNLLHIKIINPEIDNEPDSGAHFFTDWNLALSQLTSSDFIAIDDRERLVKMLKANLPMAYFPSKFVKYELEIFVLQPIRARMNLPLHIELTEDIVKKNHEIIAPVYILAQEFSLGRWSTADAIENYIINGKDNELRLLYKYSIVRIVKTKQLSVGIHFAQLGKSALQVLKSIKEKKGFIITNRRNAVVMTDIVDIDRFHIGRVSFKIAANILGIPEGSGYIQFVPAGVRTSLAYPTPVQTAKDFYDILNSDFYKELCNKIGEEKVLSEIKKDAETNGSPVKIVLEKLSKKKEKGKSVEYKFVSGIYKDKSPWNGAMAKIGKTEKKLQFSIISSTDKTKKVTSFINEFQEKTGKKAKIAWNGGYILNPELVGKLGLPESYIGSPLGLLISNNKLISAPLFNKPAFIVYNDGKIDIKKVNSSKGIIINDKDISIEINKDGYNLKNPQNEVCYYDLMYCEEYIKGNKRIIVRLAGNTIKEIIHTKINEDVKIIPVGLTISFPKDKFPKTWNKTEKELEIKIKGIDNILHAVEAGPMLVEDKKNCINMENEGWKTGFSIVTQAARLDFTDMRGPKIAIGIDKNGNLTVLTINGRIRESVGATHIDMADIMIKFGMEKAMGFDPGGSSTLVVEGKVLNISPYNSQYEKNVYSLPPEPRAVANAVIGYVDNE
ncbi:MAG: phosphodiester glycosidase family protein [Bacteroidales bacterium]|nr:phosphodiester glycosidase family protein [Bacteroidales bacterium]